MSLYTMGGRKGDDYLIALDVKTGKEMWSKKIGPSYPKNAMERWTKLDANGG